jgi:2-oxoglutarate dehydrogenase E2 component (dihydrolipoamide succinyltransferase)
MESDVRIPSPGESVREGLLAEWHHKDGDRVRKGEALLVVETDKITFEVSAEADGVLQILVPAGETVAVGGVVGKLRSEPAGEGESRPKVEEPAPSAPAPPREAPAEEVAPPKEPGRQPTPETAPSPQVMPAEPSGSLAGPAVRGLLAAHGLDPSRIAGTGPSGRITKGDVLLHLETRKEASPPPRGTPAEREEASPEPGVRRKPLSPIRRRIAERLLEARRNTAMLTTFNEIDMTRVQALRVELRESFRAKHEVSLGLMSFFVRATARALAEIPEVNASIEGDDVVYHDYRHIGVAIAGDRGLVVPVLRHADRLSFAEIERGIADFVEKIRANRLELGELEGGTFTITNGGVFGSLLSTPILNTPQSGILGMHKIEERPVALAGEVVIRPMMYVALSYDHRLVDGREAVTFLRRIKELVESPERLLLEA